MNLTATYDDWRFRLPEPPHQIGTEPGDECARIHEPDGNAPRGYRPKPCAGEMIERDGVVVCDVCGGLA